MNYGGDEWGGATGMTTMGIAKTLLGVLWPLISRILQYKNRVLRCGFK